MKKLLTITLLIAITFSACKKDEEAKLEPKQEQFAFAINYTATWCPPCGSSGAPRIKEWGAMPNVIAITAHAGRDPMTNNLYGSFAQDREIGTGIPSFWVGDTKTSSTNSVENLLAKVPSAAVALNYSVSDNKMTVNTKTAFYNANEGSYYLSVLVLESDIDGSEDAGNYSQAGTSDANYKHDFVLRASSVENKAYGELLIENPMENESVEKSYTIELEEGWKNVNAIALLWKYDETSSPKYSFVNGVK